MSDFEERISQLNEMVAKSKYTVFFGGAGVSTESGIPDFRSKNGLYNTLDVKFEKYSPEYLLSKQCLNEKPNVFFEFYRQKMNCAGYQPNITHFKLREMEEKNKLAAIITQNIDGLHQMAGSEVVYEIHGSTLRNYCKNCRKKLPADFIFENEEFHEDRRTLINLRKSSGSVILPTSSELIVNAALPDLPSSIDASAFSHTKL
jgi:NAD-dependent deacetylase